ncbi:hypothetical protein J4402_00730 [Candidatus Pacearchaeota archaeon]|nr:hypothetical protein [Candidatus Pacearchaeota archaeon]
MTNKKFGITGMLIDECETPARVITTYNASSEEEARRLAVKSWPDLCITDVYVVRENSSPEERK